MIKLSIVSALSLCVYVEGFCKSGHMTIIRLAPNMPA